MPTGDPAIPPGAARPATWPAGPAIDSVTMLLRSLELTISRRLDGRLHGNHQGLTPGHGSEPGESRLYQPGDDVRRIDWNVTARTQETHVRDLIADRDLEAWLVIDASAAMDFGTTGTRKSQLALAAAAAIGFLTARNQNKVGAVIVAGPHLTTIPPRGGRDHVRGILSRTASPPPSEGTGHADLARALDRVGAISRRRGFAAVISDFPGTDWHRPLARLGLRHELLAIAVEDPRELDVPPIGLVDTTDPATGQRREVLVTEAVQKRFAIAAARRKAERDDALRSAHAPLIQLRTDEDWLAAIIDHVDRRRHQQAVVLR